MFPVFILVRDFAIIAVGKQFFILLYNNSIVVVQVRFIFAGWTLIA